MVDVRRESIFSGSLMLGAARGLSGPVADMCTDATGVDSIMGLLCSGVG